MFGPALKSPTSFRGVDALTYAKIEHVNFSKVGCGSTFNVIFNKIERISSPS